MSPKGRNGRSFQTTQTKGVKMTKFDQPQIQIQARKHQKKSVANSQSQKELLRCPVCKGVVDVIDGKMINPQNGKIHTCLTMLRVRQISAKVEPIRLRVQALKV
jgi:hypothetical protein